LGIYIIIFHAEQAENYPVDEYMGHDPHGLLILAVNWIDSEEPII
jgi:hypothetical protein